MISNEKQVHSYTITKTFNSCKEMITAFMNEEDIREENKSLKEQNEALHKRIELLEKSLIKVACNTL